MATMACYPPFDQSNNTSSTQVQQTSLSINNNNNRSIATATTNTPQKDYSKPLHVDCSVEYELPNQARPPGKSEPLLMIHPCFYRRAESQRRSPFINNLPQPVQQQTAAQSTVQTTRRSSTRSTSNSQVLLLQQQQQQQQQRYAVQQQQQQLRYMEQVQQQAYQQTMVSSAAWSLAEQNPAAIYCKPPTTRTTRRNSRKTAAASKELSRVPDYTSSGDSGISGVLWTDTERSPATGLGTLDTITLPTPHPLDKALAEASQQPQTTSQQQQSQQQQATPATARRTGYSLRSDVSNSTTTNSTSAAAHGDLAELLAAACGADHLPPLPKVGVAPGKSQVPSQPQSSASASHMCQLGARCGCNQSRASLHQQPAVGVAAVASCRSCRPTQAVPAAPPAYQHIPPPLPQQQPWPAQFAHPPAAVPASACEPGPEPASSSASGQVRRSWSRSTNGAKRSRVSSQQPPAPAVVTSTPGSWVSNPFLETSWQQQQQQTTSCGLGSNNNNNNNGSKDCGAMCKVCCPTTSLTPQQQQQQQTTFQAPQEQQQQWNASYYCRSEDAGGRMMWNNENMLRLFQV